MGGTVTERTIWVTYLALMVLLALTLASSYLDLGVLNLVLNLGIAAAKAALIMLIFMGLRLASGLVRTVAVVGFLFLVVLIVLSLSDYLTRGPQV